MPTTQNSPILSTPVSPDMFAEVQKLIEYKQCSSSDFVKEAISNAILEAKIERGLEDVKAGRVVSHEEVKEMVRGMGFDVD